MKVSTYTITVPDYPESGSYLIYNTLTEAMAVIGQELKDVLDRLDQPAGITEEAQESLDTLIDMGVVIEDFIDEKSQVVDALQQAKHNRDTLSVMVLPTFFCNFKCVYCVEESIKEQEIYMDDETADAALAWIKQALETMQPKTLALRFYGGEPLMNVPTMERVSKELYEYTLVRGINFMIGITTNGALLTEKVVDRLAPYGLTTVKITLDGDKETHDAKRPYLSGKGTFDRIIKNIRAVSDKIHIMIGGNFDESNIDGMHRLLDFMKDTGLGEKIFVFDFKPIMDTIDRSTARRTAEQAIQNSEPLPNGMIPLDVPVFTEEPTQGCGSLSRVGIESLSEGDIPEAFVKMKRAIVEHGFKTPPGLGQVGCSMTLSEAAFIIDPLGKLYNCPPLVGREQFSIGDVWQGLNGKYEKFLSLDVWNTDHCLSCTYVPMCGSGCRYEAYLKTGDIYAPDCEKEFFEQAVPEMIKFEYEKAQANLIVEEETVENGSFVEA